MARGRTGARAARWMRRLTVTGTLAALGGGMLAAVERGSEGRALSREIERLERREAVQGARLAETMRRLDSLTSRERIARVAAEQGLRPSSDEEITFVRLSIEDGEDGAR